jgi:hypothetical protein
MMNKVKLFTSAIAVSSALALAIPTATTVFADTSSDQTAGVQFTGKNPDVAIRNTDKDTIGNGQPLSNATLERIDTKAPFNAGDVQTGVTQNLEPKTTGILAIIGIAMAIIAGYLSGLRVKLYRKEEV